MKKAWLCSSHSDVGSCCGIEIMMGFLMGEIIVLRGFYETEKVLVNFVNRPLPWQVRLHGRSKILIKNQIIFGFGGDRTGIPGFSLWCV